MYVLSHWCLLRSYKAFFNLDTRVFLSCVLNSNGYRCLFVVLCLLSVRILMLRILPCMPRCCHLLHVGSCRSIWKTLQTSLQVSILHHSSWTGTLLPFLFGYFFIARRFCINDVAQECHITALCLRSLLSWKVASYYSSSWIISRTIVTCSSEQVSSFFSCRWLYAIFHTSQLH